MTSAQKHAWFNLVVVLLTAITVLSLYPWLGERAYGGFGLLGFCGFAALFHWRRRGQVVSDERDALINRRANLWAYTVLWVVFVAAVMLAPRIFGDSVPTRVIETSVWIAFMLMLGVQSIAALIQYGRTPTNAA
ncbi:MAG TPA: hypothetical protein VHV08_17070 [Pirellulales bacterium]|nr:hypothetical protein [Pirellulales bacterium]